MTESTLLTHIMIDISSRKYDSVGKVVASTECKVSYNIVTFVVFAFIQ